MLSKEYQLRKSDERGSADHGWLKAKHTFSFADYQDPNYQRFRTMRVLNEDRIAAGKGFGMHPHNDMEIVTYVISGSLKHEDSMGNSSVIFPGDAQRMTAGMGVVHSEFNPSSDNETHLFQIWIYPNQDGLEPSYEQKKVPRANKVNQLCLIASETPQDSSVKIHQDVNIYASVLECGQELSFDAKNQRHAWIQLASGELKVNGQLLKPGDGLAVSPVSEVAFLGVKDSEFLLFDFA